MNSQPIMRHSWKTADYDDRTSMYQPRHLLAICRHCRIGRITKMLKPRPKAVYYGWGSVEWVVIGYRAPACNSID